MSARQVANTAGKLQRSAAELAEVSAARAELEELLQNQTAQTAQRQQVRHADDFVHAHLPVQRGFPSYPDRKV